MDQKKKKSKKTKKRNSKQAEKRILLKTENEPEKTH